MAAIVAEATPKNAIAIYLGDDDQVARQKNR
jgi:hypothetical protein